MSKIKKILIGLAIVKKIILIVAIFGLFSSSAQAFLSRGYNIEQLSQKADVIFMGEVIDVVPSPASNNPNELPYVRVKFKVFEGLKGNVPSIYSLKQFAPKVGKQFQLLGMSQNAYVPGQKLIMFVAAPSAQTGFTSPIDMQLFLVQSKSSRLSDIDEAVVLNKQHGERTEQALLKDLQNPKTIQAMRKIQTSKNTTRAVSTMSFKDFRTLIQASVQ